MSFSNGLEKRPKLRFPGFDEPWKICKAESLFRNITDKNHPDDTVLTIVQGKGTLPRDKSGRNIHYDNASLSNYKRVKKGDYIIHLRSFEGGLEMAHETGIVSPAYTILRCSKPHSSLFYEAYFHTDEFINHVLSKAVEGIRDGRQISYDAFKWLGIPYCAAAEQEKISALFDMLNRRIETQEQIVNALKKYKRGLLQYAFPQKGEVVPQLRFAGFSGDWERRKISDMFKVTRGYVLAATLTEENQTDEMPYPVYSSQTKDDGLMGYYKDFLYENAITWTTDGANAGTVNYRAGKFYCTNVCGVLISNEVKTSKMIAEALNNVAKNYVSYVGNPKLMNNVMADIEIMIPVSPLEQEKISNLFAVLDNLITLHQRRLDNLTKYKKGLLQQLFI